MRSKHDAAEACQHAYELTSHRLPNGNHHDIWRYNAFVRLSVVGQCRIRCRVIGVFRRARFLEHAAHRRRDARRRRLDFIADDEIAGRRPSNAHAGAGAAINGASSAAAHDVDVSE